MCVIKINHGFVKSKEDVLHNLPVKSVDNANI